MKLRFFLPAAALAALLLVVTGPADLAASTPDGTPVCAVTPDPDPPVYYAIDLVPTRKVPGARRAEGTGNVLFPNSPFGVSVSTDGRYVYDLDVRMSRVKLDDDKVLTAWVTTPSLDQIDRIGTLEEVAENDYRTMGRVEYNKFLVVITLEPANAEPGEIWTGPIVSRGMSRSGYMHTMAGHGPFESEPCAVYGYN